MDWCVFEQRLYVLARIAHKKLNGNSYYLSNTKKNVVSGNSLRGASLKILLHCGVPVDFTKA